MAPYSFTGPKPAARPRTPPGPMVPAHGERTSPSGRSTPHRPTHQIPEIHLTNTFIKQAFAALVLAGAVAAPAAAFQRDVQEALIGSGHLNVTLNDGVATLTGYGGTASKAAAERAALDNPEVTRVINLIETTS